MVALSRYQVSDESTSIDKGVMKNKLSLKNEKQLSDAETLLFADTYTYFFEMVKNNKVKFDLDLIFSIHKYFFQTLYDWAGKMRAVDISKNGMLFASSQYLDKELLSFNKLLRINLPKQTDTINKLSQKLAIIHNEFNAIHPFREGNGRTIRLFLDLMVINLGYNPIDWQKISNRNYLRACINGLKNEHKPMAKIIKTGLE